MNYFEEISHLVKKNEINKKVRNLTNNQETLETYWNIGKLIVEAQGGEKRAKYGNELIKTWSKDLTKLYGKGYDLSNLKRFRTFYLIFPKGGPAGHQLTWSHIRYILPLEDKNKRNYYINLVIERNLSKRELIDEIKTNSYERLITKPNKIEIKQITENFSPLDNIKNPIIIRLRDNEQILKEKDLEIKLISELNLFFNQLGTGYTLVGNEYKINLNGKNYYIDILLFNVEINCYVVVELKLRELRKEDKAQIEFYMDLIDANIKKPFHNKTIGIIISKKQDNFIATFVRSKSVIPITYEIKNH